MECRRRNPLCVHGLPGQAPEALKARIGSILVAAEKTGTLDEEAFAELPAVLADRLRAA